MQEVAEQLRVVADVAVPLVTGEWAERGELQALLQKFGVPFVGGPSEAVTLAASRTRSPHFPQDASLHVLCTPVLGETDSGLPTDPSTTQTTYALTGMCFYLLWKVYL